MHTDPLADLFTRIRNATAAKHEHTTVPFSKLKKEVLKVMKEQRLIQDFLESGEPSSQKIITIQLIPGKTVSIQRISKPGQRIYKKAKELKSVRRGFGCSIISTPSGVMTGVEAKKKNCGGEVLCEAY